MTTCVASATYHVATAIAYIGETGGQVVRSATDWACLIRGPLAGLRAEIWKAVNAAKDASSTFEKMSWPELIQTWRPETKEHEVRTVEARWRRELNTDGFDIEIPTMGEALEALYRVRDRIPPDKTPNVRRLLYDELAPATRMLGIFHRETGSAQDVRGLEGTWRLIHQQSDGRGFLSWRVIIYPSVKSNNGPGAWFELETIMQPAGVHRASAPPPRTLRVEGFAHGAGAMFYLVGTDRDNQIVTASFKSPRGQLPANKFDRAHGLIYRIGSRGLYAARVILTRVDSFPDEHLGSRIAIDDCSQIPDSVMEDICLLNDQPTPAFLVSE